MSAMSRVPMGVAGAASLPKQVQEPVQEIRHFRSTVLASAVIDGRKALRWSLDRLARETGLATGLLYCVECGGWMSEAEAEKIAMAFVRNGYRTGAAN